MSDDACEDALAEEDRQVRTEVIGCQVAWVPPAAAAQGCWTTTLGVVVSGNVDPSDNPQVWVAWYPKHSGDRVEVDLAYVAELRVLDSQYVPVETALG